MSLISRKTIDELRDRVNIEDVVETVVQLKRSGSSYKGLSPFSPEKTPSFHVHPDKGFFYCFSTSQGGDIFRFVQLTEGVNFQEAVESIAKRFGIEVEYESGKGPDPESRSLRKNLLELHELVCDFYHRAFLAEHKESDFIRKYWIENRRFSLDTAKEFKIGYAPVSGDKLTRLILSKGYSDEVIRKSGLFFVRDDMQRLDLNRLRLRFRGRLMIPIRDAVQGEVVAFTARQTELTPQDDPAREAKYVNSPETPIFHKSNILFNMEKARKHADDEGGFVMVEGQLDTIRCWEQGIKAAIAPQGTAITDQQLQKIRRYKNRLDVILDGDNAGRKAALRILPMALANDIDLRFIALPDGEDPDSLLLSEGLDAFNDRREHSVSAMVFAAQSALPKDRLASPQEKSSIIRRVFEIVQEHPSEVARLGYVVEAAEVIGIDSSAAQRDFYGFLRKNKQRKGLADTDVSSIENERTVKAKLTTTEYDLLWMVLHHDGLLEHVAELIDIEWIEISNAYGRLLSRILMDVREDIWDDLSGFIAGLEDEEEINLLYAIQTKKLPVDDIQKAVNTTLKELYSNNINRQIDLTNQKIASTSGTDEEKRELYIRLRDLKNLKRNPPSF